MMLYPAMSTLNKYIENRYLLFCIPSAPPFFSV